MEATGPSASAPLAGIRVIESGLLLNGGTVGMLLADMGAEVIKLEDAGRGDYIRSIMGQISPGRSPAHLQINKNKKSVAIDLKAPEGKELFFALLKTADIFIDGLRPGAHDRLGLGYEDQRRVKPDIVYVQYTGYGASGPYANVPTHGYQMNALAGGLPTSVDEDGMVHRARGVQYMGGTEESSAASALGAHYATMGALGALVQRLRTGRGAYVDVAASDAVMATAWMGLVYNLNYERIRDFQGLGERTGRHEAKWPEGSTRYQLYRAADGKAMLLGAIEPKFWAAFCTVSGRPDLIDTMVPGLHVDYGADKTWLRQEIQAIFAGRTSVEWMDLAREHGLPIGPAPTLEELPDDPHVAARGMLREEATGPDGPFTYIGFPAQFDHAKPSAVHPAPVHGAHTLEVLTQAGLAPDHLADLLQRGVLKQA